MPPPGIETGTPCFPACLSNHSAIGAVDDILKKTFTTLIYPTILQELLWCAKGNMKIKNKTLLTYSFGIDTI